MYRLRGGRSARTSISVRGSKPGRRVLGPCPPEALETAAAPDPAWAGWGQNAGRVLSPPRRISWAQDRGTGDDESLPFSGACEK